MSKIKDFPLLERPREKALRYGIESLSDEELLAILLRSGYKSCNVKDIASNLLSKSLGLKGINELTYNDLIHFKGIKQSKALILSTVFEIHRRLDKKELERNEIINNVEDLYNKYKAYSNDNFQEIMILVIVNNKNCPIYETVLFKGGKDKINFSFPDLYRELLTHKGKGFYLIHNHPNGDNLPSNADIILTNKILYESKKMNIPLLDHIIIGEDGYTSLIKLLKAEL